jgi:hypothetical protein
MSRASILALGRSAAALAFVDACTITRVTGTTTSATGVVTEITSTIYTGPCRVQEIFGFARDTTPTPPDPVLMRYRTVQLPVVGSEDIRADDRVTITASAHDPDLVGVVMVVRDQSAKSEATSRRVGVEELT